MTRSHECYLWKRRWRPKVAINVEFLSTLSERAQSTSFGITQGCPSWKQQTERMVMKAGLNLLNFASWANPRALQKLAENEEQLGYHFLMISDHVAVTPDVAACYRAFL